MPDAITVVALQPVTHDGRSRVCGEVFTVAPIEAAVLVFQQTVRFAESFEHPTKALTSLDTKIERAPVSTGLDLAPASDVPALVSAPVPARPRRRRAPRA